MSYEQIKDRKHFDQFVKKFETQRKNIKSAIISRKIGEEAMAEEILKAATPVVEAIKQQTLSIPTIQSALVSPVQQLALDAGDLVGPNNVESQKILSDVMAVGQLVPTSFEVNIGNGKIGTNGLIDQNKLLNEDKIIFTSENGGFRKEIPKTLGLLYLLLAPYKFIKSNNLRDNVITKEDELMYVKIMHKAGMDSNAKKRSTKYKTMIKGIDTGSPLQMTGDESLGRKTQSQN